MIEVIDRPEDVGLSRERLDRIGAHLEGRYVTPGRLPGVQVVVARGDRVAWHGCLGDRDAVESAPTTADTVYRIYSMTKPITTVALLSLYEEGRFQLDDPVGKFLAGWGDLRVWEDGDHLKYRTRPAERPMTVRDLLTHTSGLTYGFMARHPVDALYRHRGVERTEPGATLETMVDTLATLPLLFSPGTRWSYSVATDVCGRLCEVLTGQRFDEVLAERVLAPLGMRDTGFSVRPDQVDRLAANYQATPDGGLALIDAPRTSTYLAEPTFLSGGGGLVSTAGDYLRFARMLAGGGTLDGVRVLGRRTVQYMASNHLPTGGDLASMGQRVFSETTYEGVGFGLGVSVVIDPVRAQVLCSAGEFGWGGAASTVFWVDPVEDVVVLLLTQLMPSSTYPVRRELRTLVYQALVG